MLGLDQPPLSPLALILQNLLEAQIVKALEGAGRLTTRDLAMQLGADRNAVYRCCKRLEKAQLIDALEAQFERLSENIAADSRSALEEFAEELIEVVSTATTQGDVTSHLGIRSRH